MKGKNRTQKGAVLVVALIMLSMVTFLVVAFVGFTRFERASVQAAMVRTEAVGAVENGLTETLDEVMGRLRDDINHGVLVEINQV